MNDSTHHSELLVFSSRNGNGLFGNPRVASTSSQRIRQLQAAHQAASGNRRQPQTAAGSFRQPPAATGMTGTTDTSVSVILRFALIGDFLADGGCGSLDVGERRVSIHMGHVTQLGSVLLGRRGGLGAPRGLSRNVAA